MRRWTIAQRGGVPDHRATGKLGGMWLLDEGETQGYGADECIDRTHAMGRTKLVDQVGVFYGQEATVVVCQ